MDTWTPLVAASAALVAVGQFLWAIYKDRKSGALMKGSAEAAKASLDAVQAEQSLPHVQESLRLGNVAEAVAIQQQIINGLREQVAWQDSQLGDARRDNEDLRARLADRDAKIDELERRLGVAEHELKDARRIIDGLRADPDHTPAK